MREGFFAMFDALGFKGIWERAARAHPPWDVLGKLERLVGDADDVRGGIADGNVQLEQAGEVRRCEVRTLLLSDTIVAAAAAEDATGKDPANGSWAAFTSVSAIVAGVLAHAANEPDPRLAYRGCISHGKFDVRSNFIIGPAVDEAATLVGSAEAALVWLTPSANKFMSGVRLRDTFDLVRPWRVPLKAGHYYDTYVISPYEGVREESWEALRNAIMGTFAGNAIDVQLKAQHTRDFLDQELGRLRLARPRT